MFKKVVIIDDNQTQLKILESQFSNREWEVFCAKSIEEGITLIYSSAPDLIITDAIMPKIGGFQLIKQLREDETLKKIPIIVYSVLTYNLARFYIKEGTGEYFLTKSENYDEILDLADKATTENPIFQEDKMAIINKNLKRMSEESVINLQIENIIENHREDEKEFVFNIEKEKLSSLLKNSYSVLMNDEKLPKELFSILHPLLSYDLCVLCFYDFSNKKQTIYFDIQNFIFNPILQNYFTAAYNCNNVNIIKKLMPNSKTITSINEFNSKIELDFDYKQNKAGKISFYSQKPEIWNKQEDIDSLKQVLNEFFISRHINKGSQDIQKITFNKYSQNEIDLILKNELDPIRTKIGMYLGILNIANYSEIEAESYEEDMDILNLKIAELIVKNIMEGEQIGKLKEDEYALMLLADDDIQAQKKFGAFISILNAISVNDKKLNIKIGISNCFIDDAFDMQIAQKRARKVLETINEQNKAVIYAE